MTTYTFSQFSIEPGRVEYTVTEHGGNRLQPVRVWFEIESGAKPAPELVALTCATIAGRGCEAVHFELPLGGQAWEAIRRFTAAECSCLEESIEGTAAREAREADRVGHRNLALSFSGGMDSLGLLGALPDETKLVAVDWGGDFARERIMFDRFKPWTVRTNLRQEGLNRRASEFMGVGILLACDELAIGLFAFGSNLEERPSLFLRESTRTMVYQELFEGANLCHSGFGTGLTSIGTARLACHYFPDEVYPSLNSLGAPGRPKRHRKQSVVEIDTRRWSSPVHVEEALASRPVRYVWGIDMVDDFVMLYILKHRNMLVTKGSRPRVPAEVRRFVAAHSLRFMERINPTFRDAIPIQFRQSYEERLLAAGIVPYTDSDYEEFYRTGEVLRGTRLPAGWQPEASLPVRTLRRLGLGVLVEPIKMLLTTLLPKYRR